MIAVIIAVVAAVALLVVTLYFALLDVREFNAYGVKVYWPARTPGAPSKDDWLEFADKEINRFFVLYHTEAEWAAALEDIYSSLAGLKWFYRKGEIKIGDLRAHAVSRLGKYSAVGTHLALGSSTDGHELRLQITWILYGGSSEKDRLQWMTNTGVFDYSRSVFLKKEQ